MPDGDDKKPFQDPEQEKNFWEFNQDYAQRMAKQTHVGPKLNSRDKQFFDAVNHNPNRTNEKLLDLAFFLKDQLGQKSDGSIKPSHHESANKVVTLVNEFKQIPQPPPNDPKIHEKLAQLEHQINAILAESEIKINSEPTRDRAKRTMNETLHPRATTRACIATWDLAQAASNNKDWREEVRHENKSDSSHKPS